MSLREYLVVLRNYRPLSIRRLLLMCRSRRPTRPLDGRFLPNFDYRARAPRYKVRFRDMLRESVEALSREQTYLKWVTRLMRQNEQAIPNEAAHDRPYLHENAKSHKR